MCIRDRFKTLLVRTYSNALTQYRNQQIDFKPLKAKPEDTDVVVRTEVRQPGAKAVQIDYNLEKLADGWKVYDVLVAGVSLVTNYRDDFGKEVRTGGIDGLIKFLKDKNKQLEDVYKRQIKSCVFGVAVALIAVFEGYDCVPTAEGVSRAITRTVVSSALAILALDFVMTSFMFRG